LNKQKPSSPNNPPTPSITKQPTVVATSTPAIIVDPPTSNSTHRQHYTPTPLATGTTVVFPTSNPNTPTQQTSTPQASTPTPTPTPTHVAENFEEMSNIPYCVLKQTQGNTGWCADDTTNITLDDSSKGDSPTHSVKFASTTKDIEMASTLISVQYGKSYNISSFLNLAQISGGSFSYYIDEYDSGRNDTLTGKNIPNMPYNVSSTTYGPVSLPTYTPSSPSVAFARLQFIVKANSGIEAYVDSFKWDQE
jgi:hypothetical protein